jgi:hypothetical protein
MCAGPASMLVAPAAGLVLAMSAMLAAQVGLLAADVSTVAFLRRFRVAPVSTLFRAVQRAFSLTGLRQRGSRFRTLVLRWAE